MINRRETVSCSKKKKEKTKTKQKKPHPNRVKMLMETKFCNHMNWSDQWRIITPVEAPVCGFKAAPAPSANTSRCQRSLISAGNQSKPSKRPLRLFEKKLQSYWRSRSKVNGTEGETNTELMAPDGVRNGNSFEVYTHRRVSERECS